MGLDRYQLAFAKEKVDGYFCPRPNEKPEAAFERARAECAESFRKDAETIALMSWDEFRAKGGAA